MKNDRKPRIKQWNELHFAVGIAPITSDDGYRYLGPCAEVKADDTWLIISTDDVEGTAMLNIEALPALLDALRKIAKELNIPVRRKVLEFTKQLQSLKD